MERTCSADVVVLRKTLVEAVAVTIFDVLRHNSGECDYSLYTPFCSPSQAQWAQQKYDY